MDNKIRLSQEYISTFIRGIGKFLPENSTAELRLYGSRTKSELKGGDIDLLVLTETPAIASELKANKAEILGTIFKEIEEQKIDLYFVDSETLKEDPFAQKILEESVLLHRWK